MLLSNGYRLQEDGVSLRQAVSGRQYKTIDLFLAAGLDVNLHKADMVYPYNPTAVTIAAQNNDLKLVQLLVQHGADQRKNAWPLRTMSMRSSGNCAA